MEEYLRFIYFSYRGWAVRLVIEKVADRCELEIEFPCEQDGEFLVPDVVTPEVEIMGQPLTEDWGVPFIPGWRRSVKWLRFKAASWQEAVRLAEEAGRAELAKLQA